MTLQRRDNRHAYTGSRAFWQSCRHGGDCPWCKGRRSYRRRKGEALILDKVREYEALGSGAREEEQLIRDEGNISRKADISPARKSRELRN